MVDDSLIDYLQIGIIQYFNQKGISQDEIQKSLESLGFRVGYSLIEKYKYILLILNNLDQNGEFQKNKNFLTLDFGIHRDKYILNFFYYP